MSLFRSDTGQCRRERCGRPVLWLRHVSSNRIAPIDRQPDPAGNIILVDGGRYRIATEDDPPGERYVNHYVTCANPPGNKRVRTMPAPLTLPFGD